MYCEKIRKEFEGPYDIKDFVEQYIDAKVTLLDLLWKQKVSYIVKKLFGSKKDPNNAELIREILAFGTESEDDSVEHDHDSIILKYSSDDYYASIAIRNSRYIKYIEFYNIETSFEYTITLIEDVKKFSSIKMNKMVEFWEELAKIKSMDALGTITEKVIGHDVILYKEINGIFIDNDQTITH